MRKKGRWLMALLLSLFFVACTPTDKVSFDTTLPENENNTQAGNSGNENNGETGSSTVKKEYQIVYKAVINGSATIEEIPSLLWIDGNRYPEIYVEGDAFQLDDLLNEYQSKTLRLVFLGWYTDSTCQTPFTGVSRYDTQGDFEQATGNDYTSFNSAFWDTTSGVPVWK